MDRGNTIGSRIESMRKAKGITQAQLAKEMDVLREQVVQWESNTRAPKIEIVIKLANFFEVTCDLILRGIKAENTDINKLLGLEDSSIDCLKYLNLMDKCTPGVKEMLNFFITQGEFPKFLLALNDIKIAVANRTATESGPRIDSLMQELKAKGLAMGIDIALVDAVTDAIETASKDESEYISKYKAQESIRKALEELTSWTEQTTREALSRELGRAK